jgi:hypothetical protein
MKTLGGVGVLVLGGMLLLTIKIGPVESPRRPTPVGPTDVAAAPAVNKTLLESAPAPAAPVPELRLWVVSESDGEKALGTSIVLLPPPPATDAEAAKRARIRAAGDAQAPQAPQAPQAWTWAMSLPAGILRL